MNRAAWLAALVLIGSFIGHAQSPSTRSSISGVVQDQTGATIVGARIELGAASTPAAKSTTTDQAGRFEFKRITAGKYQLDVSCQRFESTTLDGTVGSHCPVPLQV